MAADIEATVYPGQPTTSTANVSIPSLPPAADVLFSFDCTASMDTVLDTTKANAVSLMGQLEGTGVSFHFAVASFMDYPGTYTSCGYSSTYGDASSGDYPYKLNQAMTTNMSAVTTAVSGLKIGYGVDSPEAYTRQMYESYADTNVLWRTGAKRVMVIFGDDVPHDCNLNRGIPGTGTNVWSTGGDPGRDGIMGTSDDLDLQAVLSGMVSNHVVMLAARIDNYGGSSYAFNYWTAWTRETGGKAFQSSGTTLINDLMHAITNSLTIMCVQNLQVLVTPTNFSSWLTANPPVYAQACSGDTPAFHLAFTPPPGTPGGDYSFSISVQDNQGVQYLSESVLLHVIPPVPLPVALNNATLTWMTASNIPWFGQTNVSHDGVSAGRSCFVGDGGQTSMSTTTNGPGTLSFWWEVSSQTNADLLSFICYGGGTTSITAQISGEVGWQQFSAYLPGGPQTLVWTYSKDASQSAGLDAGFVDQVSYAFGPTLPFIIADPQSQQVSATTPVTFSVLANGTPTLAYQWRVNGKDILGATSNVLALPSATWLDAGTYAVRVSNPYGVTNSANAALSILPIMLRGDDSMGQIQPSLLETNPAAIAAGSYHTLALLQDGTVAAWGEDDDGQCDPPPGLTNVVQVAGGGYHSLALSADGSVTAWGGNEDQQCNVPAGLTNVLAVAAGFWHSLALRADGTVVAWGDNSYGQTSIPAGLNNVVAIAAGGNHSLALRADGTVAAWGDNLDAYGSYVGQSAVPAGLNGVQGIGAGEYHSLAVRTNGAVAAWGDDSQGQCDLPPNLTNAVAVTGGGGHSLAIKADSSMAAWGANWNGQCNLPTNLLGVACVAAGDMHSVVLFGLTPPKLIRTRRGHGQFTLMLPTYAGMNYALEYETALQSGVWTPSASAFGHGGLQMLTDLTATNSARYYRVRVW